MGIRQSEIREGLVALGIRLGDAIEVHSSLRSFGHVDGGAGAVVDALLETVGPQGAVVMSAYRVSRNLPLTEEDRVREVTTKLRYLPEGSAERSGMGVVVDEFLRRDGVVCGNGTHRLCAWGHDAEKHIADEYLHLVQCNGWAVLLGVGIETCSSLHLGDQEIGSAAPPDIRKHYGVPEEVRSAYPPDMRVRIRAPYAVLWPKAKALALRKGIAVCRPIGKAKCTVFRVREMLAVVKGLFHADPYAAMDMARPHQALTARRMVLADVLAELMAQDPDCSIVLGGSMARNEEREDSDIDVFVFLSREPERFTDLISETNRDRWHSHTERQGVTIDIGWCLLDSVPVGLPESTEMVPHAFVRAKLLRDPSGRVGRWVQAMRCWLARNQWVEEAWSNQYEEMRRHKKDPSYPLKYDEQGFIAHLRELVALHGTAQHAGN